MYNHNYKRKRINGSLIILEKLVSPNKINHIFTFKRILINSKDTLVSIPGIPGRPFPEPDLKGSCQV